MATAQTPDPKDLGMDHEALSRLDASIQADIDQGKHFGAAIVVARGGVICHRRTFGRVAPERVAAVGDLYLTMSLSKSFTAALVLRAIDQGRFTLDTPVAEVMPEFAAGGKKRVTVRMLLTHTGGTYAGLAPLPGLTLEDMGNLAKMVGAVAALPAAFTPGERCFYNSFGGIHVLAQMLVLTDPKRRNFGVLAREDLFEPLGMRDTVFGLALDDQRRVPVSIAPALTTPMSGATIGLLNALTAEGRELPAGGAWSTVDDVYRFAEMIRMKGTGNGHRLISPALFDYAARNHTGDMTNGAWEFACEAEGLPRLRANFSLLGGYSRDEGHFLTGMGYTASSGALCAVGGGSTMWMVDPARDLTFVFLSAGLVEGLAHLRRLSRLSDLALASCAV